MNYKTYGRLDRAFRNFTLQDAYLLKNDVLMELTDGSMDISDADRAYAAWFLRNYIFLPVSLITEMLEYSKPAKCWDAIENVTKYAVTPASLDGDFLDCGAVRELQVLVKEHYLHTNTGVFLDRLDDETAEYMLYQMAKLTGYEDVVRGGTVKPYESTPKEPSSLSCICEIISMWERGCELDDIDELFVSSKINK